MYRLYQLIPIILMALLFVVPLPVKAEVVAIMNKANQQKLSTSEIRRIFLGKITRFKSGQSIKPIVPDKQDINVSREFNRKVLRKNKSQLRAYWAKQIFTAKGKPPQEYSMNTIIELIKQDRRYISYINAEHAKDQGVRIIQLK